MDATKYGEREHITAQTVNSSSSKKALIVGDAVVSESVFQGKTSQKLSLPVELDGRRKVLRMNTTTVKNVIDILGAETISWHGRWLSLNVVNINGKESVIGMVLR